MEDAFLQPEVHVFMKRGRIELEGVVEPRIPIVDHQRQVESFFQGFADEKIGLWWSSRKDRIKLFLSQEFRCLLQSGSLPSDLVVRDKYRIADPAEDLPRPFSGHLHNLLPSEQPIRVKGIRPHNLDAERHNFLKERLVFRKIPR